MPNRNRACLRGKNTDTPVTVRSARRGNYPNSTKSTVLDFNLQHPRIVLFFTVRDYRVQIPTAQQFHGAQLSCRRFIDSSVRLQLFALAYNLANLLRRPVLLRNILHWSLTTLSEEPHQDEGSNRAGMRGMSGSRWQGWRAWRCQGHCSSRF